MNNISYTVTALILLNWPFYKYIPVLLLSNHFAVLQQQHSPELIQVQQWVHIPTADQLSIVVSPFILFRVESAGYYQHMIANELYTVYLPSIKWWNSDFAKVCLFNVTHCSTTPFFPYT